MNRREFIRTTAVAGSLGLSDLGSAGAQGQNATGGGRVGPKAVVKGKKAVCSSDNPLVTDTMLQVMKDGGNAADAAVAGAMAQATVNPDMTNHTGSVDFIYFEAKTGKSYMMNSTGTLVSGLPAFRPVPTGLGVLDPYGSTPPMACIPGFMPGMGEIHRRFGTKPWKELCEPAIRFAEDGFAVTSFHHAMLYEESDLYTYFPSARELITPNGFLPEVGDMFKNPKLAQTLRRVADEGPEYFTKGEWAKHFVEEANRLGWRIKMEHMTAVPPRWDEPFRFQHNGYEIIQLAPPERQGLFCALVLGILENLNIKSLGHYTESAETLYYFGHALRRANWELGLLNDPAIFDVPTEVWTDKVFIKSLADILRKSKPKIDLTEHVKLTSSGPSLIAAGLPAGGPNKPQAYKGSCELSIVDQEGNWVEMMDTLQSGGIPGVVVDGVIMVGSHAGFDMENSIAGWLTGGGRLRCVIGNTIVLKNGKPVLSLGTPGNVHVTIPQVLSNILDYGMDPYEAICAPRMLSLRDDYTLAIESRLPPNVIAGLVKLGIHIQPLEMNQYPMGSFQVCWRDEKSGLLNSCADPRRAGAAGGF